MRRWNLDHQPVVVDNDEPAVPPGESYDFSKEQLEAGLAGTWSDRDPRKGRAQEKAFKQRRDAGKQAASGSSDSTQTEPATPDKTEPAQPEKE